MATYQINLAGQVNVQELNTFSPHQIDLLAQADGHTLVKITTDQSGLLGVLSFLHHIGLTVLTLSSHEANEEGLSWMR